MTLIRFMFRLLATLALAVAVIMLVVDATRSIAADELVLTPLAESWHAVSPESLSEVRAAAERADLELVAGMLEWVLASPGSAVMALLALVLFVIGRRPSRRVGRFVVEG